MAQLLKTYKLNDLLCTRLELNRRISLIQEFTQLSSPKVSFEYNLDDMTLIRRTEKVSRKTFEYGQLSRVYINQVIKVCNRFYKIGLIHGDLNRKNVFISSNQIVISDWEPALKQILFAKPSLMGTIPYLDIKDTKKFRISLSTD